MGDCTLTDALACKPAQRSQPIDFAASSVLLLRHDGAADALMVGADGSNVCDGASPSC
jgi:hypothetical protein